MSNAVDRGGQKTLSVEECNKRGLVASQEEYPHLRESLSRSRGIEHWRGSASRHFDGSHDVPEGAAMSYGRDLEATGEAPSGGWAVKKTAVWKAQGADSSDAPAVSNYVTDGSYKESTKLADLESSQLKLDNSYLPGDRRHLGFFLKPLRYHWNSEGKHDQLGFTTDYSTQWKSSRSMDWSWINKGIIMLKWRWLFLSTKRSTQRNVTSNTSWPTLEPSIKTPQNELPRGWS